MPIIQKRRITNALGIVLASALAVVLSACGSSSNPGSAPNTGASSGQQTIRVANFGLLPSSAYFAWAIEGGYFKQHNLDVQLLPAMVNATDLMNAVNSGEADVALTAPNAVVFARQAGRPVKVVSSVISGYPLELAFKPDAIAALKATGITESSPLDKRVAALKGMTFGTSGAGSSTEIAFRYLLEKNGLNPDQDVTLQPVADVASMVAALGAGRIDAAVSNLGGSTTLAASQGIGEKWEFMTGDPVLSTFPFNIVASSESYINQNPETLQSFLDALYEARAALVKGLSPDDTAKLKAAVAPDMADDLFAATLAGFASHMNEPFTTSDDAWKASLTLSQYQSDKPIDVTASDAIDNTFAGKVK